MKDREKPVLYIDIAAQFLIKVINGQHCPTNNWTIKLRQHLRIYSKKKWDKRKGEKYTLIQKKEEHGRTFLDQRKNYTLSAFAA